jgi:hypothetical protein
LKEAHESNTDQHAMGTSRYKRNKSLPLQEKRFFVKFQEKVVKFTFITIYENRLNFSFEKKLPTKIRKSKMPVSTLRMQSQCVLRNIKEMNPLKIFPETTKAPKNVSRNKSLQLPFLIFTTFFCIPRHKEQNIGESTRAFSAFCCQEVRTENGNQ